MTNNYRRKDYFIPRSMREAFGSEDSFEPEIRCCSELFYEQERRIKRSIVIPAVVSATLLAAIIYIVNFVLP